MQLCKRGTEKDIQKFHLKYLGSRKYDGVRVLAIADEQVKLIGRNNGDYTKQFQEVVNDLKEIGFKGIIDGEICCDTFNHTLSRNHTQNKLKLKILERTYPAIFYVFDVLNLNGLDLRQKPLLERLEILSEVGLNSTKSIKIVENTIDLINLFERAKKEKFEGIIIKNPISKYTNDRSWNWLKIKLEKTKDLDFTSYSVNPAGVRVETNEGIAIQVTGSNSQIVRKLIDETGSARLEVKYLEETINKKLRQVVFKDFK